MDDVEQKPLWTQEEAIAFECAREVICDMMAICTGRMADETRKPNPDTQRVEEMRARRAKLAQELTDLHFTAYEEIARIRAEYGAIIRAWREEHRLAAE
jgi:hypothetical protein